jgi:hypothetical protein
LALCLNLLEFISTLFVHFPPNDRAFVSTLSVFLQARGHSFVTEVSLQSELSKHLWM